MAAVVPECPAKSHVVVELPPTVVGTPVIGAPISESAMYASQMAGSGPVPVVFVPTPLSYWSTDSCDCSKDIKSSVDVLFCHYCQASRQYNVLTYGRREVEPLSCLGALGADICLGYFLHLGTFTIAWHLRQRLRKRYMIAGDDFSDCLHAFFLPHCVLCQNYREMSLRGEWPSGLCIDQPFQIFQPPPVHQMIG